MFGTNCYQQLTTIPSLVPMARTGLRSFWHKPVGPLPGVKISTGSEKWFESILRCLVVLGVRIMLETWGLALNIVSKWIQTIFCTISYESPQRTERDIWARLVFVISLRRTSVGQCKSVTNP